MPGRPYRVCAVNGCPVLTLGGPCARHAKKPDLRRNRHQVYNLRAWRDRLRPAKLAANPLCEDCEGRGLLVPATDVDHVDGDAGNWEWENLRALCHPCHARKTALHDGSFGHPINRL